MGGGRGGGGLESVNFFHKESNGGRGAGGRGRWIRWMDKGTVPNQFAPSTSSKLGASQCINVQVMSLTSSIMTILSFDLQV